MTKNLLSFLSALVIGLSASAQIVITEISYNPPESGSDSLEFIELFNSSSSPVVLANWSFTQGVTYTFPNDTILSNDYYVVAVDSGAMNNVFGINCRQWTGGSLSNGGEDIVLVNDLGVTIDSVDYDDNSPWPSQADGMGPSLVFCDTFADNNLASNWAASTSSTGTFINGNELMASPGGPDTLCVAGPPPAPTVLHYPIGTINTEDASGIADSLGVLCFTSGVVVGIDYDGNNGYSFYIMDTLGNDISGINVFNFNNVGTYSSPQEGDSVLVRGTIGQFNGLTQIVPDSILLLNQNNPIPDTQMVATLSEATEAELVMFDSVYMANPMQWMSSGSFNADIVLANGDTITMRVDSDTDVQTAFTSAPLGVFDLHGIGGQFDSSNPFTDGYQIFPRYATDIDTNVNQPSLPVFNFIGSSIETEEADGQTIEILYSYTNASFNAASVELDIDLGATTAASGTDFTTSSVFPISFNVAPFQNDTDTLVITIADDMIGEQPEFITLELTNAVGAAIGFNNDFEVEIKDNDLFRPIADINNVDANGEPDSLDLTFWTKGIVLGIDLDGNNGYSFTIWDGEGINVFNFNDVSNYVVTEGDSIEVRGEIWFFNGLTEIFPDSIRVINQGNTLPEYELVTNLAEENESAPIRLINVTVIDPNQWGTGSSSFNVDLLTCSGDTIIMRADSDTDIGDVITAAPAGSFAVRGIGGQFDNAAPYFDNHQIFPMSAADFDLTTDYSAPSLVINEIMPDNDSVIMDDFNEYDDWIELYNTGSSAVSLAGLFLTDDANVPMNYMIPANSTESIAAGDYALIWADNDEEQGDLHASFSLSAAGEYVGLVSYDGCEVVDGFDFPAIATDLSYGRISDGSDTLITFPSGQSTPNAMNMIDTTNSIASVDGRNNQLIVYPNPTAGKTVVTFNYNISFEVYDVLGNLVGAGRNTNALNVETYNAGVYLIKAENGEVVRMIVR